MDSFSQDSFNLPSSFDLFLAGLTAVRNFLISSATSVAAPLTAVHRFPGLMNFHLTDACPARSIRGSPGFHGRVRTGHSVPVQQRHGVTLDAQPNGLLVLSIHAGGGASRRCALWHLVHPHPRLRGGGFAHAPRWHEGLY
jgi:hypothetical protein